MSLCVITWLARLSLIGCMTLLRPVGERNQPQHHVSPTRLPPVPLGSTQIQNYIDLLYRHLFIIIFSFIPIVSHPVHIGNFTATMAANKDCCGGRKRWAVLGKTSMLNSNIIYTFCSSGKDTYNVTNFTDWSEQPCRHRIKSYHL